MNILKKLAYVILSVIVLTFSSCQPDEDENGAPTPTTADARDKFAGSWTASENSSKDGTSSYTVHIKKDTASASKVKIENFYNYGFQNFVYATISSNSLSIPLQNFSGSNKVQGSGTLTASNKITMTYTVDDGSGNSDAVDNVSATLAK